jgi:hypothetical protein
MHLHWKRRLIAAVAFCLPAAGAAGQSIRASAETAAAVAAAEPVAAAGPVAGQTAPPAVAFEYSDAYRLRARIHKASSLATLPLFAAEGIIGQSLYSNPTGGKKDAHLAVAAGIGALFAVNTVTGTWNLLEARKDPNHRKRRLLHGLLMLGADAGFVTTAALGPDSEHGSGSDSRATHRAAAITSIGLATTGYLVMLLGAH